MTAFNWKPFLDQWSRAILASPDAEYFDLPPEVVESGWLGFPSATEAQIAAAEARLGVALPPSYREFVTVSNGWRHTGNFVGRILPVEDLRWVRDQPQEWFQVYIAPWIDSMGDVPFDPARDEADYRHLNDALLISAVSDEAEMFLLNPNVTTPGDEWEAWMFAHWIPGLAPYASFQALLQAELDSVTDHTRRAAPRLQPGDASDTIAVKLPGLIAELEQKAALYRPPADAGSRPDLGHAQGTYEGLSEVAARARSLQAENPVMLRERLRALAREFEDKHHRAFTEQQQSYHAADLLKSLLVPTNLLDMLGKIGKMSNSLVAFGRAEGYRQGAAIIRWHLNE